MSTEATNMAAELRAAELRTVFHKLHATHRRMESTLMSDKGIYKEFVITFRSCLPVIPV